MKKFTYAVLLGISVSAYGTQVHTLNEASRLQANICPTEMNRIAIQGDRIAQVFGAEGTFTHQVDEETGQFFLKPVSVPEGSAQENGFPSTPISLTLVTESGVTQDMTLYPREKTAATILLKSSLSVKGQTTALLPALEGVGQALPYQEGLIQAFKTLVTKERPHPEEGLERPSQRINEDGITVSFVRQRRENLYVGYIFEITNTSSETMVVQEKQFFQPPDLALALSKTTLKPLEKATLYVIRRG